MSNNPSQKRQTEAANDYARNMFHEGHNRSERNRKIEDATAYDKAAHTSGDLPKSLDSERDINPATQPKSGDEPRTQKIQTASSRAGTEAVGEYDETGGPLGGTEEELDDMESAGTPVDKTRRMRK
ncbi:MAG: hypothetical protein IT281_10295 [Ignavibacteria bacterium]|nr:hypothetical protein [Ignavibacteria bacterium]